VVERYRCLQQFAERAGFEDEARWLADRLQFIVA